MEYERKRKKGYFSLVRKGWKQEGQKNVNISANFLKVKIRQHLRDGKSWAGQGGWDYNFQTVWMDQIWEKGRKKKSLTSFPYLSPPNKMLFFSISSFSSLSPPFSQREHAIVGKSLKMDKWKQPYLQQNPEETIVKIINKKWEGTTWYLSVHLFS